MLKKGIFLLQVLTGHMCTARLEDLYSERIKGNILNLTIFKIERCLYLPRVIKIKVDEPTIHS